MPIPIGIVMPSLILGTTFGRVIGIVTQAIGIPVTPDSLFILLVVSVTTIIITKVLSTVVATICGGAYVGAIANSLSAAMVLVEMTGFVFPHDTHTPFPSLLRK